MLGDSLPLTPLGAAVAAAVWLGGYRPALAVAIFGYFVFSYFFIPPRGELFPEDASNLVGLGAYLFTASLIIVFGEAMRRAQMRSSERGEILRVTLGSIGDAVITTDVEGRITYLNAVAEELTGWSVNDALGRQLEEVFNIINEDTRAPVESPAIRSLRDGVIVGLANHTVLIKRDGGECPVDDSAAPIKNELGEVSGCVLIFRDVSEKRRLESQLADKLVEARLLASIVESSEDPIISKTLDGTIQTWNAAAERLFGYTSEEAIGQHISLIIPTERRHEEEKIVTSLKGGRRIEHLETERARRDGEPIPVSLTISPIRDDDGRVTGASKIVRDITARKQADAEREKFVTLIESSTDFIGMCDLDGVPFFVNRAGLKMVGLDDLEAARRAPVREFFFPEDQAMIMNEFFPNVLEKGHGEIEVRFRHFKTGEPKWMSYKVLALKDAAGEPVAFATVSQDVTERRRLEDSLRGLAADLSEADRRKNEFLAMLAHELRNPLAPISNAVSLLRSDVDEKTGAAALDMLERQVAQMRRLVDDLLDVSRVTQGKIELRNERIELAPVIEQSVEAVSPFYGRLGLTLNVSLPEDPVYLYADRERLAQVIGNLLNNASKFTNVGGTVSLTVQKDDGSAVIKVRDDGIGIREEDLSGLFEMFTQVDTSLERSRGGLGIGLTLARTLVEMSGGTIEARSDGLGHGSEFEIRLPIDKTAEQPAAEQARLDGRAADTRRVLIVDDNVDGAESLAMLLKLRGHETFLAHDGREAIEAAERLRPDAVLLDIGLPTMNGYDACREIRNTPWGADMLLVAVTGWGQQEDRSRSESAGFNTHIVKPVNHDLLIELLATVPSNQNHK